MDEAAPARPPAGLPIVDLAVCELGPGRPRSSLSPGLRAPHRHPIAGAARAIGRRRGHRRHRAVRASSARAAAAQGRRDHRHQRQVDHHGAGRPHPARPRPCRRAGRRQYRPADPGQDPLPEGGVYVLELSTLPARPDPSLDCDVAVLLNITPDHLDRYGGMAGLRPGQETRSFATRASDWAVVGVDDAHGQAW